MQWTAEVATVNKAEATHNFIIPRIRANHLSERAYPYARYPIGSDSRLDKLVRGRDSLFFLPLSLGHVRDNIG